MRILSTAKLALGALRRNPMRAMLTTLGIVIGVGAVIAMVEIGNGSSAALKKSIASMGANVLLVRPGTSSTQGVSSGAAAGNSLTPQDAEALLRDCPSVKTLAPIVRARVQVVRGSRNWAPNTVFGSTPRILEVRDWENLAEGEPFTDHDVKTAARVCLIGKTIVRELFDGESPVGQTIRVGNVTFTVVGVLRAKGANMIGMDQDDTLIAPWTTVRYRVSGAAPAQANQSPSSTKSSSVGALYPSGQTSLYPDRSDTQTRNHPLSTRLAKVDEIMAIAADSSQTSSAVGQITDVLRRRHRLKEGAANDFEVRDMSEMSNVLSSTTALMSSLLLLVAMISLLVGGVGIMNIMLVSVTERTREIGLRMAVGAKGRDILRQFLVEAVVLCLAGGAIGIGLGHGGSLLVRAVLRWPVEASLSAIVLSVAVSATVGTVFGFYPAWKASRMDPIEALRYE